MKQNTVNILLELGVPAGIKGFTYICDAASSPDLMTLLMRKAAAVRITVK